MDLVSEDLVEWVNLVREYHHLNKDNLDKSTQLYDLFGLITL